MNDDMMTAPKMSLDLALVVLAAIHTRDDDVTGFVVNMGVSNVENMTFQWSTEQYVEAWGVVREHLHQKVTP